MLEFTAASKTPNRLRGATGSLSVDLHNSRLESWDIAVFCPKREQCDHHGQHYVMAPGHKLWTRDRINECGNDC